MESKHRFPQALENAWRFPHFHRRGYCFPLSKQNGKIVVRKREKYLTPIIQCRYIVKAALFRFLLDENDPVFLETLTKEINEEPGASE